MTTSSSSFASHAESKSGSGRTLALFVGKADRYHQSSSLDDLSPRLIERFLRDVGSDLADETELPTATLGRRMNIVSGPAEACFHTPQVTGHVRQLVTALAGEMSRSQMQAATGLRDRNYFTTAYLRPALEAGLVEMTLCDKPTSRNQRYRRTAVGEALARHVMHFRSRHPARYPARRPSSYPTSRRARPATGGRLD